MKSAENAEAENSAFAKPRGAAQGPVAIVVDLRWPNLMPLEWQQELAQLKAHIHAGEGIDEQSRQQWQAMVSEGTSPILLTTNMGEAKRYHQRSHPQLAEAQAIYVVPSAQDPVFRAQSIMQAAVERGEWERQHTHRSLLPFLEEEAQEVAAAITQGEGDAALCSELGDLLLQVLFHAEIAARRGAFDFREVAQSFLDKMQRRAPYLFDGSKGLVKLEKQEELWIAGKRKEHPKTS